MLPPIAAAQAKNLLAADLGEMLTVMAAWNFLFGYVAAGLLLAYLAALAIDSVTPIPEEDRLVGLQFVLVIGAVLFSAAVLTDKASLTFTVAMLDSKQSKELIAALNRLPDIWAVAYSGILLTAIGTAYFSVRGEKATVNPERAEGEPVADSPLALRTPSGKDFKILGWLVNLVIAFAPVWATEGLAALVRVTTASPPG